MFPTLPRASQLPVDAAWVASVGAFVAAGAVAGAARGRESGRVLAETAVGHDAAAMAAADADAFQYVETVVEVVPVAAGAAVSAYPAGTARRCCTRAAVVVDGCHRESGNAACSVRAEAEAEAVQGFGSSVPAVAADDDLQRSVHGRGCGAPEYAAQHDLLAAHLTEISTRRLDPACEPGSGAAEAAFAVRSEGFLVALPSES